MTYQKLPTTSNPEKSGCIITKAYQINLDKIEEGYLSDTKMCYALNINEAKKILLNMVRYDGWKLKYWGEDLTYLNIPVLRNKSLDKILFEGEYLTESAITEISENRKRTKYLDNILSNSDIKYCYIIKGGYYRPYSCGYTSIKTEAGIYTKEEAVSHAKSVREIRLEIIDINEHNKMIQEKINELQSRIII